MGSFSLSNTCSHCVFLAALAFASTVSPAAKMAVYRKVDVGVPGVDHERRKGAGLFVRARTTVLEAHDMHLQDPGFTVARDQIASIATGACCAKSGGATREQVAGRRARRRTVVGAMVQLVADA